MDPLPPIIVSPSPMAPLPSAGAGLAVKILVGVIVTVVLATGGYLAVKYVAPTTSPTPSPSASADPNGAFCGGIAGVACATGYECRLDGNYPDAGGTCIKKTEKDSDISDWKLFNSKYFTLSFKVPPTFTIEETPNSIIARQDLVPPAPTLLLLRYDTTVETGTRGKADTEFRNNHSEVSRTTVIVDGSSFIRLDGIAGDSLVHQSLILFDKSSLLLSAGPTRENLSVLNQILSTFKFTSSAVSPSPSSTAWKTFINSGYRYRISYPGDWSLSKLVGDSSICLKKGGASPTSSCSIILNSWWAGSLPGTACTGDDISIGTITRLGDSWKYDRCTTPGSKQWNARYQQQVDEKSYIVSFVCTDDYENTICGKIFATITSSW